MQFHYVVVYDTVLKRWFMELDTQLSMSGADWKREGTKPPWGI